MAVLANELFVVLEGPMVKPGEIASRFTVEAHFAPAVLLPPSINAHTLIPVLVYHIVALLKTVKHWISTLTGHNREMDTHAAGERHRLPNERHRIQARQ
jgi:hypothetical protein